MPSSDLVIDSECDNRNRNGCQRDDGGRKDSASFAGEVLRGLGWEESRISPVQHCIRAHRYRGKEGPETIEAKILFDADKLDVVGAFGVARTIGYAVQAGQPIFS